MIQNEHLIHWVCLLPKNSLKHCHHPFFLLTSLKTLGPIKPPYLLPVSGQSRGYSCTAARRRGPNYVKMLTRFEHLCNGCLSFKQPLCYLNRDTAEDLRQMLRQRLVMDRRRLEEGFLLLGSIEAVQKHNLRLSNLPSDRNTMIELVTKEYSEAFVKKWGGMYNHSQVPHIMFDHQFYPFFVLPI